MTKRISFWRIILLLWVLTPLALSAQSKLQDLYKRLETTTSPAEKMRINYELATLNLARKPSVATFQANQAYTFAKSLDNSYFLRKSAILMGKSFIKQSDNSQAIKWLKTGENLAKINKDLASLLEASTLQSGIEIRKNNYRKAYEINLAAINYVNRNKKSFQKTLSVPNTTTQAPSVNVEKFKQSELKLTNDIEELKSQNEALIEEILRLQYDLDQKKRMVETVKRDSQVSSSNDMDSNRINNVPDSLRDHIPAFIDFEKSKREKLFSWLSAILGFLSLGLLAGLYFLNKKKEEQKENFDNSLVKKERLIRNYKEEIEEQESLRKRSLLGKGNGAKAKKINLLSILVVDLGTNLEFEGNKKTDDFINFYSGILSDIKALLSQYPNVFYIKKMGPTLIFGSGIDQQSHDPDQLLKAAKDIQDYIKEHQDLSKAVKIGIHSGPVFLSTIDYNTESLDILGHTFDQCAWIQSLAKDGQIVISGITKSHLKQAHLLELISQKKDWTGQLIELFELN